MKKLLTWVIIFVLGFIVGAGVGFKVLEWISGELLLEAWDNSYQQFQQNYPSSALDQTVEEQKWVILEQIKEWLRKQATKLFAWEQDNSEE